MALGYVYLIGSAEVRPVKIGLSADPRERLQDLQPCSPVPLQLLWYRPGGGVLERLLHEEFRNYRLHGEWFDFGEVDPVGLVSAAARRLLNDVNEGEPPPPVKPVGELKFPWRSKERVLKPPRGWRMPPWHSGDLETRT